MPCAVWRALVCTYGILLDIPQYLYNIFNFMRILKFIFCKENRIAFSIILITLHFECLILNSFNMEIIYWLEVKTWRPYSFPSPMMDVVFTIRKETDKVPACGTCSLVHISCQVNTLAQDIKWASFPFDMNSSESQFA